MGYFGFDTHDSETLAAADQFAEFWETMERSIHYVVDLDEVNAVSAVEDAEELCVLAGEGADMVGVF